MKKTKIILDTDIGDDIDDAFALAYAYNNPKIELLGVTTVFKDTMSRAKQVLKYFDSVNEKNIPVRAGIGTPIKQPIITFESDKNHNGKGYPHPCQYDESYDKYQVDNESAVDFIARMVDKYPKEIVLVPIGPLTNIAAVITNHPNLVKKINKIILMGGDAAEPQPEWNILCDPEAADIVFRSGIDVYCVGINVTLQCTLEDSLLDELTIGNDNQSRLLKEWFDKWSGFFNFHKSVMHDPLAVASLVEDTCVFEKVRIKADLVKKRGSITVVDNEDISGNFIYAAMKVDKNKFYGVFKKQVLNNTKNI